MDVVAGVDLGGTAVNYTLIDQQEKFLIDGLCEHPSLSKQGPEVCLQQIADGLAIASSRASVNVADVVAIGLDTRDLIFVTGWQRNWGSQFAI